MKINIGARKKRVALWIAFCVSADIFCSFSQNETSAIVFYFINQSCNLTIVKFIIDKLLLTHAKQAYLLVSNLFVYVLIALQITTL